ncbi:hypothetical protein EUTSA_v10011832mg [Eutrema salsugineum]|uniref:Uncharacterized protein n=1 Tax=Eutrema salsugineum TaxID=72664 RepID=V4KTK0_EUTSA|nr:hypothetical protein EUTSA_v10011832mg [Eutrema salsugineum]
MGSLLMALLPNKKTKAIDSNRVEESGSFLHVELNRLRYGNRIESRRGSCVYYRLLSYWEENEGDCKSKRCLICLLSLLHYRWVINGGEKSLNSSGEDKFSAGHILKLSAPKIMELGPSNFFGLQTCMYMFWIMDSLYVLFLAEDHELGPFFSPCPYVPTCLIWHI